MPPALGAQILNHWTTREVLISVPPSPYLLWTLRQLTRPPPFIFPIFKMGIEISLVVQWLGI